MLGVLMVGPPFQDRGPWSRAGRKMWRGALGESPAAGVRGLYPLLVTRHSGAPRIARVRFAPASHW